MNRIELLETFQDRLNDLSQPENYQLLFQSQAEFGAEDFESAFLNIKRIDYIDEDGQAIFETYEGFEYDEETNDQEELDFAALNDGVQTIIQKYLHAE